MNSVARLALVDGAELDLSIAAQCRLLKVGKRTGCTVPRLRPRSLAGVVSIILAAAPFWSYRSGQANRTESPPVRAVAARSLRSSATASTRRSG